MVCDDVVEPISLNPLKEFSEKYYTIIRQVFDGLVRFDSNGRIEPALAEKWHWIDDMNVEFKLRQGVEFHDGEPLTAEAVRFSIERFTDPTSGFPGAGFISSIESVEVVDAGTLRIKTRFPDGILLHRLASLIPIMPPKYIAEHGMEHFGRHPVGTGAFRFVRWDPGERIVLEANKKWWDKGFPGFNGLIFMFLPVEAQVEGLLAGKVDIVTELPGTATLRIMKSGVAQIVKKETFYTMASSLNCKTGPLSDKRVRQALNYALNREYLVRYDLLGNGRPLATLTMEGESGHDPSLRPYPYAPEKAVTLLREAGYPNGFHLKALVKIQGLRTMRIIAKQLAKIGVVIDIDTTTDTAAVRDMTKKPWDWIFAGCPDAMCHSFFIQFIFLSSLSPFSVSGDGVYDRMLGAMANTIDEKEQQRLGRELDRYIYDQALSLFTYQRIKTYGVRNGVHFVPSITGMPIFCLSHEEDHAAAPH